MRSVVNFWHLRRKFRSGMFISMQWSNLLLAPKTAICSMRLERVAEACGIIEVSMITSKMMNNSSNGVSEVMHLHSSFKAWYASEGPQVPLRAAYQWEPLCFWPLDGFANNLCFEFGIGVRQLKSSSASSTHALHSVNQEFIVFAPKTSNVHHLRSFSTHPIPFASIPSTAGSFRQFVLFPTVSPLSLRACELSKEHSNRILHVLITLRLNA